MHEEYIAIAPQLRRGLAAWREGLEEGVRESVRRWPPNLSDYYFGHLPENAEELWDFPFWFPPHANRCIFEGVGKSGVKITWCLGKNQRKIKMHLKIRGEARLTAGSQFTYMAAFHVALDAQRIEVELPASFEACWVGRMFWLRAMMGTLSEKTPSLLRSNIPTEQAERALALYQKAKQGCAAREELDELVRLVEELAPAAGLVADAESSTWPGKHHAARKQKATRELPGVQQLGLFDK